MLRITLDTSDCKRVAISNSYRLACLYYFRLNPKFDKNSASEIYLVIGVLGIAVIPYVYTTLKEFFLGVNIYIQDGVYYYVFRNPKVPHFLERQGLCYRSREEEGVWIAVVHSDESGSSAPTPLPKTTSESASGVTP